MTRLKRTLIEKGIITDANAFVNPYDTYETEINLVSITETVLTTVMYSNVLDPILFLYDRRTLEPIGQQDLYPTRNLCNGKRTWGSWGNTEKESGVVMVC